MPLMPCTFIWTHVKTPAKKIKISTLHLKDAIKQKGEVEKKNLFPSIHTNSKTELSLNIFTLDGVFQKLSSQ